MILSKKEVGVKTSRSYPINSTWVCNGEISKDILPACKRWFVFKIAGAVTIDVVEEIRIDLFNNTT